MRPQLPHDVEGRGDLLVGFRVLDDHELAGHVIARTAPATL
jgi:hypothetical protein